MTRLMCHFSQWAYLHCLQICGFFASLSINTVLMGKTALFHITVLYCTTLSHFTEKCRLFTRTLVIMLLNA